MKYFIWILTPLNNLSLTFWYLFQFNDNIIFHINQYDSGKLRLDMKRYLDIGIL